MTIAARLWAIEAREPEIEGIFGAACFLIIIAPDEASALEGAKKKFVQDASSLSVNLKNPKDLIFTATDLTPFVIEWTVACGAKYAEDRAEKIVKGGG